MLIVSDGCFLILGPNLHCCIKIISDSNDLFSKFFYPVSFKSMMMTPNVGTSSLRRRSYSYTVIVTVGAVSRINHIKGNMWLKSIELSLKYVCKHN